MAAASGPIFRQLDEVCVSGWEAYDATEPAVNALGRDGAAAVTQGLLTTDPSSYLPDGAGEAARTQLLEDLTSLADRQALVLVVPPEALALPPGAPDRGDAAGFQVHANLGDVLIPVGDSGCRIAQVLHVVLNDVARQTNTLALSGTRGAPDSGAFCAVGLPHGAMSGFDPFKPPATGPGGDPPDAGVVSAAAKLSDEDAMAEALEYTLFHEPDGLKSAFGSAMRRVFGRGSAPRAGSRYVTAELVPATGGSPMFQRTAVISDFMVGAGTSGSLRSAVARQRALREYMSSTLYCAGFLRDCSLHEAVVPTSARTVIFACGRAAGVVIRRLAEVAERSSKSSRSRGPEWGLLHRICVVVMPTLTLEAKLSAAADGVTRARSRLPPSHDRSSAAQAAFEEFTASEAALDAALAESYRSFARVIRAGIPERYLERPSSLAGMPAELLWTAARE